MITASQVLNDSSQSGTTVADTLDALGDGLVGVVHIAGAETVTGPKLFQAGAQSGISPAAPNDLVIKSYVDNISAGTKPAAGGSVACANTATLPAFTYANGTAGVGATMTATSNGAIPTTTTDSVALMVGQRFWHWDQTGAGGADVAYGIWALTQLGGASAPWIAVRTTDADTPAELGMISAFITGGITLAGQTLSIPLSSGSITVGTTPLPTTVVGGPGGVTAETQRAMTAEDAISQPVAPFGPQGILPIIVDGDERTLIGLNIQDSSIYLSGFVGLPTTVASNTASIAALSAQVLTMPVSPQGVIPLVLDGDSRIISGLFLDGSPFPSVTNEGDDAATPMVYTKIVDGFQHVFLSTYAGEIQLTSGAYTTANPRALRLLSGKYCVQFASTRGGQYAEWRVLMDGTVAFPVTSTVRGILDTGQSLSQGVITSGASVITASAVYPNYALMMNQGVRCGVPGHPPATALDGSTLTSFVGLHEQTQVSGGATFGETPCSSAGNATQVASQNLFECYTPIAFMSAGLSGTDYTGLKKGTVPYANGLTEVTRAKVIANARGQSFFIPQVINVHGEADVAEGTSRAQYLADLTQWQSDLNADVSTITGQSDVVQFILSQVSSWTSPAAGGFATTPIPLAQLDASEDVGAIHCACPKYFLTYGPDGVHLPAAGYVILGEYYEKVLTATSNGAKWIPLKPLSVSRAGAVITIQMNVPSGPLVLDTSLVADPGHFGFTYSDATSGAVVSSVTIVDAVNGVVQITLNADPGAAASKLINYAMNGVAGNLAGPLTGARGCLRDSDPSVSSQGGPLYNWCVHFSKSVT